MDATYDGTEAVYVASAAMAVAVELDDRLDRLVCVEDTLDEVGIAVGVDVEVEVCAKTAGRSESTSTLGTVTWMIILQGASRVSLDV